jgi:hypothetical protein
MYFMNTNIYNMKTKAPTLMDQEIDGKWQRMEE